MPKRPLRWFAASRSANTDPAPQKRSAPRRRRSTGCKVDAAFKKNESIRSSRPRTAPTRRGKHTHTTKQSKNAGRDARARRADGAHLLRRLLRDGRDAVAVHDRNGPREPRTVRARVHLLVHRDRLQDHLEPGATVVADGPDGLPRLGQHQHPGRGAEEARRHHERRPQERVALHGPHGRPRLGRGGRARRGR